MIHSTPFAVGFALLLALCGSGCGDKKESRSTNTHSGPFPTLEEKQEFLERYVTFRRKYLQLEFKISYLDGAAGRVSGPSEWDIRVLAAIPEEEIDLWVAGMIPSRKKPDTSWVRDIPNAPIDLRRYEWYGEDARKTVGVDRERRVVLYRSYSM